MVVWIALLSILIGTGVGARVGPSTGVTPTHPTPSHPVVTPMDGTSGGPS